MKHLRITIPTTPITRLQEVSRPLHPRTSRHAPGIAGLGRLCFAFIAGSGRIALVSLRRSKMRDCLAGVPLPRKRSMAGFGIFFHGQKRGRVQACEMAHVLILYCCFRLAKRVTSRYPGMDITCLTPCLSRQMGATCRGAQPLINHIGAFNLYGLPRATRYFVCLFICGATPFVSCRFDYLLSASHLAEEGMLRIVNACLRCTNVGTFLQLGIPMHQATSYNGTSPFVTYPCTEPMGSSLVS